MKTNLDSLYMLDEDLTEGGVWFRITDTIRFRVAHFDADTQRVRKVAMRVAGPHKHSIRLNTLSDDVAMDINVRTFVESCVLDWEGIEIDGEAVPFSKEDCIKLLKKRVKLFRDLEEYASSMVHYREELGND